MFLYVFLHSSSLAIYTWWSNTILCTFTGCCLKEHPRKRKKMGSSSSTTRTKEPKGGIRRFLTLETTARFSNIVSHWATLSERPVKLDDFPDFELVNLVQICSWQKVVEWPHPVYGNLVNDFYANFNIEIDTLGSEHLH